MSYENNKLKISALTWNDKFELPDGSYSVPDIQDYLMYIIRKHDTLTDNPQITICVDKIKNGITFKSRNYLELPK